MVIPFFFHTFASENTFSEMTDTFETVRKDNRLLYEYIRGSYLYNLQMEDGSSDVDTSGLFLAPKENFFGLEMNYQPLISDERHDTTWFELGNFCQLLLKSNPTVLEALFVPNDKIITNKAKIYLT